MLGHGLTKGSDASGEAISSNGIVFNFESPICDLALQNTSCPEYSKCLNGRCLCNTGFKWSRTSGSCIGWFYVH